MLKNDPYMKAYLNVINESTDIEKYQQIAKEIGGEYIPKTNTIDCKGLKVQFEDYWLDQNGSFTFKLINTSNDWSNMFYDCVNLNHLPEDFMIPNHVVDTNRMFYGCESLQYLPDNFTIPNSVVDCSWMFKYCYFLIRLSDNFTIPKSVTNCRGMFKFCESLTQLPYCFHIPEDANSNNIFDGCDKLENKDPKAYMMWEI